jgi:hypothetical protein
VHGCLVVEDGGCRGGGPGQLTCAEATASNGLAAMTPWGVVMVLQGLGGVLVLRG